MTAAAPLRRETADPDAGFGDLYVELGRLDDAVESYRAALQAAPAQTEVRYKLALLLGALERYDEAIAEFAVLVEAAPASGELRLHYADCLSAVGCCEAAAANYQSATDAEPALAAAWRGLGATAVSLGRHADALPPLDRALALAPDDWAVRFYRGTAQLALGRYGEAAADLEAAYAAGDHPGIARNLANALNGLGRHQRAREVIGTCLVREPDCPQNWDVLGSIECEAGRFEAALEAMQRAHALKPNNARYLLGIARALRMLRRADEAVAATRQAIAHVGDDLEALLAAAVELMQSRLTTEAAEALARALQAKPGHAAARAKLLHCHRSMCAWQDHDGQAAAVLADAETAIAEGRPLAADVFNLLSLPVDNDAICRITRHAAAALAAGAQPLPPCAPQPRRRIRLGYLLPYTHFHSMPLVLRRLVAAHDREAFEVHGYCIQPCDGSAFAREFRGAFDRFRDLPGSSPAASAEAIREDGIDVLVDTTGLTPISCLPILARRPAPVQMHAIGYGLTTGADYVDYLVTDRQFMPPEWRDSCTERLVYLPDSFMPTVRPPLPAPDRERAAHGLPADAMVFANFNHFCKLEPDSFGCWLRILARVPDSVLWLGDWDDNGRTNLRRLAAAQGLEPGRLVFAPLLPHGDHVSRIALADLCLDTLHHGGGVTSADVLWAGVPLLTLRGATPPARLGSTLATAAGLPDLIVDDAAAYEAAAVALAHDRPRLAALRARLEAQRDSSPLFDGTRYRRHLEQAYRLVWQRCLDGLPPADLAVEPVA